MSVRELRTNEAAWPASGDQSVRRFVRRTGTWCGGSPGDAALVEHGSIDTSPKGARSAPVEATCRTLGFVSIVETIVVAYDDPGSCTLARAADLAQGLNAALIVTNVVSANRESAESVIEYGHERLEQARAYLAERGVSAELVPTSGQPAEAIIALAEERNADLIVVGMRKKHFLERLVEGSVAQDVMRRATCDVLAVH